MIGAAAEVVLEESEYVLVRPPRQADNYVGCVQEAQRILTEKIGGSWSTA